MQRSYALIPALAASAMLTAQMASADVVAQYNFQEFDTAANAWDANNGPYQNSALTALGSGSTLANVGLSNLEAQTDRATLTALPSFAVLVGASSTDDVLSSDADYLGFTFTAAGATDLTNLSFDFGASNVDNNATLGLDASAQLYYSIDGAAFASIGATQTRSTGVGPTDVFTGMINSAIDLSSLSLLAGQTVELRLSIADNRGYGSSSGAPYIDNVVLNAVPEPASLALLGLGGLAMIARRRA